MMRSRFDEQLAQLHRELIEMGALCEEVIALSAQALTRELFDHRRRNGVERTCRLVHQQHLGLDRERAGGRGHF